MAVSRQRLIVLFDGTWNDPVSRTNVYRLAGSIADYDGDIPQHFFYSPGVGTGKFGRLIGGATGHGLSPIMHQGYDWLARRYRDGDEIYVFGFSRGAYTARSLVGLMRKCGLPLINTLQLQAAAEKLYRNTKLDPDDPACVQFRDAFGPAPPVHFLGVWDTVGALGIPGTMLTEKAGGHYAWHDTELSKIVARAYHAMALDEHRAAYDVALWTSPTGEKKPENLEVEQRWFIGAHANVGGGYDDNRLSDLALLWMQQKAQAAGLVLKPVVPASKAHLQHPSPSYEDFFLGAYKWYRDFRALGDGRFYRRFSAGSQGDPAVGITVDPSVWLRWRDVADYRPPTLLNAGLAPP